MTDRYASVLVVDLLGGIGDLVMLLPAVHALARRHPNAALRVLTHEPGAELVRGDPAVAEVRTPQHAGAGAEREAVAEALAADRPDLAITTTRYDGIPDLLAAGAGRAITDLWRDPPPDEPVGRRYLRILHQEGLIRAGDVARSPRLRPRREEIAAGEATLRDLLPSPAARPVVLITGAGMAVKRWPWRRWHRLVDHLTGHGRPVLTVGPSDGLPAAALPPGDLRWLAGAFRAVARRGGVVVGGDTGPLRVAAAAGARTVGLFGPTTAARYGVGAGVDLQGLPECPHRRPTRITEQPCWWSGRCPLSTTGPACMADLATGAVAAAVHRLAARGPYAPPTGVGGAGPAAVDPSPPR